MQASFSDRICVITGAASGIGRALAVDLAGRGATLALSDIDEAGLAETLRLINPAGSNRMRADRLDVADASAIKAYARLVEESLGKADYLFNVAGLTRLGRFEDTPLASFERIMDVNFWGVVRMSKAFLPQLIATRGGLINISSLFGFIGYPAQSHYCASKFAVRGFSETIATELEDRGVRVSVVHPGGVDTAIAKNAVVDKLPPGLSSKQETEERFRKSAITSAAVAARTIVDGAARGKRRIVIGRDARIVSFVQRLFPQSYWRKLTLVLPTRAT